MVTTGTLCYLWKLKQKKRGTKRLYKMSNNLNLLVCRDLDLIEESYKCFYRIATVKCVWCTVEIFQFQFVFDFCVICWVFSVFKENKIFVLFRSCIESPIKIHFGEWMWHQKRKENTSFFLHTFRLSLFRLTTLSTVQLNVVHFLRDHTSLRMEWK